MNKRITQVKQGIIAPTDQTGQRNGTKGFTLIELSMALLFVSFIMLFLVTTLFTIMRTYNKGVWVSQINQAGRQINADIGDQMRFSGNVVSANNRLCVGGIAYLWNEKDETVNSYSDPNFASSRLVLIRAVDKGYCNDTSQMPDRPGADGVSVLLGSGVVVQRFDVTQSSRGDLLRVNAVFSTGGDNQPQLDTTDGQWRCGDVVGGTFIAGSNHYCAFIDLNLTVFGRNSTK